MEHTKPQKSGNHDMTTAASSAATRAFTPRSRPQRVLVADDEHLVAVGLRSHLLDLGMVVIGPAADGSQAVELSRTEKPDLAILDIRMPNVDGLEAGNIISKQFGIPVIIVSAYSDQEYLDACNDFQTYGYLLKPVTQDDLRVCIGVAWSRFLEQHAQRDETERLRQRLDDRRIIEQAKWLLVERKNITEPEAMRLLQHQARNSRRTLIDVAKALLESEMLLSPSGGDGVKDDGEADHRG